MDTSPEDAAPRREMLEHWAAAQRQVDQRPIGVPSRTRRGLVRLREQLAYGSQRLADRVVGRGLDTSGVSIEPEHDRAGRVRYEPSAWHVLPRALNFLGVSEGDTFVDFGCGKGRVIHQAAIRPFRRVIGIEISPVLAEIARANLAARRHQHRCQELDVVVADVTQFQVPDDLTIAYLCHPVEGEALDAVIRGIIDSIERERRPVSLIYVFPIHDRRVLATGRFRLLKRQSSRILDTPTSQTAIFEGR